MSMMIFLMILNVISMYKKIMVGICWCVFLLLSFFKVLKMVVVVVLYGIDILCVVKIIIVDILLKENCYIFFVF